MLYGGVKLLQHLFYRPWHRPLLQINRILAYGVYTWGAWKKTPLQAFIYKTIVELPQPFLENIPQKLQDECTTPLEHKTRLYPLQSILCQTVGKLAAFLALLESNYCLGGHLRAYAYRELAHSFTTLACTQIPPESVHNRLAMAYFAYTASWMW